MINYKDKPILSPKLKTQRVQILKKIEKKGGLYALAAKLFADDEVKGSLYIAECFEQCQHPSTFEFWGRELVLDIIRFRFELEKCPLENQN